MSKPRLVLMSSLGTVAPVYDFKVLCGLASASGS